MQLDSSPIPLYYRIASDLREQIKVGKLKSDVAIPSEEKLCKHYGVSRITVRRAIDDLIVEGLLTRRRGVGTFVGKQRTIA